MLSACCTAHRQDAGCAVYHGGLDNILHDLTHANGNLKPHAAALDVQFAQLAGNFNGFVTAVETHQTAAAVAGLPAVPTAGLTSIARVVPWKDFADYHYRRPKKGESPTGETEKTPGDTQYPAIRLRGVCGWDNRIAWFTLDATVLANLKGQEIIKALALSEDVDARAKNEGLAIIEITATSYRGTMHKPNALHGFCEQTLFVPELTGLQWGLTGGGRREVVVPVFAYGKAVEGIITVRHVAY